MTSASCTEQAPKRAGGDWLNEDERQVFHILLGLLAIALAAYFGKVNATILVGAAVLIGLVLVHLKLSQLSLGPIERLLERFERPGVTPGYGALTLAAGMLAILTLLDSAPHILASLCILGFGDAGSTLAGIRSKRKLPWSREKTFGGTAGFLLFSLPSAYFAGLPALAVSAAAALAESFESHIDDNLTIAVVCIVAFRLLSGMGF